jgi:hypothetical protein
MRKSKEAEGKPIGKVRRVGLGWGVVWSTPANIPPGRMRTGAQQLSQAAGGLGLCPSFKGEGVFPPVEEGKKS